MAELADPTLNERLQYLATRIADKSSAALIESHCLNVHVQSEKWWDIDLSLPEDARFIAEAVEYLELRGLLQRHPEYESLVRWES